MPLRYKFLVPAGMLILAFFSVSYAQKKAAAFISVPDADVVRITPETTIPADFAGHKARILFQNLKVLIAGKNIKGKPVYGKLTVDDLFAFTDYSFNASGYMNARDAEDSSLVYSGRLWRLRSADEFPEPEIKYVNACGSGGTGSGNLPLVSSREELVTPFKPTGSLSDFWRNSVFYVESFVPKTRRRDYKGSNTGDPCSEIYVPLRQTHYVLSFASEQPFRLFKVSQGNFSLAAYSYGSISGAGFANWSGTDVVPRMFQGSYYSPLFVVKLVPPYISTKTFTKKDPVEGKMHIATQNALVVDLVGIWLYDHKTGAIVSREAADTGK